MPRQPGAVDGTLVVDQVQDLPTEYAPRSITQQLRAPVDLLTAGKSIAAVQPTPVQPRPSPATALLPPTILPAICQLLLVYIQRATLTRPEYHSVQPAQPAAAAPGLQHDTLAPYQKQQPQILPKVHDAAQPPNASDISHIQSRLMELQPQQAPATYDQMDGTASEPPAAVIAVRQLRVFDIPVPLLLQAAAHLMVVGALLPACYRAVQVTRMRL